MAGPGFGRYDTARANQNPYAIQDIHRKMNNMLRMGTIEKMDHSKAQCRIKVGPLESAWVPWHAKHAGEDSDWSPPSASEQVMLFCPSGSMTNASFLHGLYGGKQGQFKQPSTNKDNRVHMIKDGTTITHDTQAKTRVTQMADGGSHTIASGQQQNVVDTNGTRLVNDKATVHVQPDGTVRTIAASGQGSHILTSSGMSLLNC